MSRPDLSRRFTHHPPTDDQAGRDRVAAHERLRAAGLTLAELIVDLTPEGPERKRAIDAVDDAVMLANAALARPRDSGIYSMTIPNASLTFQAVSPKFDPSRFGGF